MNSKPIKLKGVYKKPDWKDEWHFREWKERTNPNIDRTGVFKVSVSTKVKKKRKLQEMIVKVRAFPSGCTCCGDTIEIEFQRASLFVQ